MDPFKNIVDSATDYREDHEEFYDERLSRYDGDRDRWATAIDRAAYDVLDGVAIGSTGSESDIGGTIGPSDFPRAAGTYYVDGLRALVNDDDLTEDILRARDEEDLGRLVVEFTKLRQKLDSETSGDLDPAAISKTLEALVEKLTTKEIESDTLRRPLRETETVADTILQLFGDPAAREYADALVDLTSRAAGSESILSLVDDPQLTTSLWDHQIDALKKWIENDRRGYVNMATATGKTVLGLAAISQRFDGLHPADTAAELRPETPADTEGNLRVLIVAGQNLLLDQWRDEFETHLNVPKHRTIAHQTDTGQEIRLSWGTVEFRTSQQLADDESLPRYDLVILDEAHRYAKGSSTNRGWRDVFERLVTNSDDILAMSGSIDAGWIGDETVGNVLREELDEVKTFTLPEAKSEGVVADFSWHVSYVPAAEGESVEKLAEVTEICTRYFDTADGPDLNDFGESVVEAEIWTLTDLRSFANTNAGRTLREHDEEFDTLANAAFSRTTRRWQLEPEVDSLVDVLEEHRDEKSVVLVEKYSFAEAVARSLAESDLGVSVEALTDRSADPHEAIEKFNEGEADVLIGPGSVLGTGVDLPDAEVAINVGKGGINSSLVQRIGRVLRNPTGEKDATFYHLMSVPTDPRATIFHEDGRRLLEQISSFALLGEKMDEVPYFECRDPTVTEIVEQLEREGVSSYSELPYDLEQFFDTPHERERVEELCEEIETTESDAIVSFESAGQSREGGDVTDGSFEWQSEEDTEVPSDTGEDEDSAASHEDDTDGTGRVELPDDLSEEEYQYVVDVAEREPIPDDELIDLWELDSRIELARITKGRVDDYLTRDEDGHVCTTERGRHLYEGDGGILEEDEQDDRATIDTTDEVGETDEGDDSGSNSSESDSFESESETSPTSDSAHGEGAEESTCIYDHSTSFVKQVQAELGVDRPTANRLLDLYTESGTVDVEVLIEGWGFEKPQEVYTHLNERANGLYNVVGMGDLKLKDVTRSRIDDLADSDTSQDVSSGDELPSDEETEDEESTDEDTGTAEVGDTDDSRNEETETDDSQRRDEQTEAAVTVAGHYTDQITTDRDELTEELLRIEDHALYPPSEEEVVSESEITFGSYVYVFGSFADVLSAAGYHVGGKTLLDEPERAHAPSEVVAAVQILADLLGGPVTESTFERLSPITEGTASTLGTWRQVTTQSGLDPTLLPADTDDQTRETITEAIADVTSDVGRLPTPPELRASTDVSPERAIVEFGSWSEALEASVPDAVADAGSPTVDLEGASEATRRFHDVVARTTDEAPDYDILLRYLPRVDLIDVVESRREASLPEIDVDDTEDERPDSSEEEVEPENESEEGGDESTDDRHTVVVDGRSIPEFDLDRAAQLRDDLYRLHREFGHPPRPVDVQNYGRFTPSEYSEAFGSWSNVLSVTGLDFEAAWVDEDDHDDELLTALSEVAERVSHRPTTRNIDELTDYSATSYVSRWGSMDAAIENAGLDVVSNTSITDLVESGVDSWDIVHDLDDVQRERASREALLLLKRGWTGPDYQLVSEIETRIDVGRSSYASMWEETVLPVLRVAESRGLVDRDEGVWAWVDDRDR